MKRRLLVAAIAAAVLFLAASCASVNVPVATGSGVVGSKTGQATGTIILGMFGNVDAGMVAAAREGGITQIGTVDTEFRMVFLPLVVRVTTTVTGE